ncbi:unnamed protein product [Blepharisma stoltei]|uniref:Uncharacterized protein n=1 Tax=Blepharisma stoltei TaxID=1481888 RepID=A0AAU9JB02_9CILI|nr:unnamed protein product [Blepharisma stoltei]
MGCGIPSKRPYGKKHLEDDEETSLKEPLEHSESFCIQTKINHPENNSFHYKIQGTNYRITVALIQTPNKSLVMS